ncbi:hypothetical protein BDB00DRAFT_874670 [Zychaea mexicana]|uniref:uncharacterized protein n=1 Tax=Zychaea mexicana TaxID=64656 RepID=UPI0022FED384|nr:uncharacterized protein BDB00DRAFT_874670 [Zychaea mexicana]KAI9491134.1 hypothetical protein BDB00DRAFT_874670 [Zychaea mexicana]
MVGLSDSPEITLEELTEKGIDGKGIGIGAIPEGLPEGLLEGLAVAVPGSPRQSIRATGKVTKVYSDALFFVDNFPGYLRTYGIAARIFDQTTEIQESNSDMRRVLNNGEGGFRKFRYNPLTDTIFYISNEAHHMLEKRTDMMLTVILNELSFGDILRCMTVSKAFRRCNIDCPTMVTLQN